MTQRTTTHAPGAPSTRRGCGCPEYDRSGGAVGRRGVLAGLAGLGAGAVSVALGGSADAATSLTFGDPGYAGDTLVVLSLRGGFDGLSAVVPVTEQRYYDLRPTIAVPVSRTTALDSRFGLHPALAPLLPLYRAGSLAFVHALGLPDPTRSHFQDMAELERAAPGSSLRTGWLDRMVGATTTPGIFAGTSLGTSTPPPAFAGPSRELALRSVDGFELYGAWNQTETERWTAALTALHAGAPTQTAVPAQVALQALGTVTGLKAAGYTPAGGAAYPEGRLGDSLRDTARLVKAGVGLRAVTVDVGDWDMHAGLGRSDRGWMFDHLTELAAALAAFATDLGPSLDRVTLVTLSEFGRRVKENGSGGVDHGHGNVSMVLGGKVNGGAVYGSWPGLADDRLVAGDLAATTDYRSLLGEIIEKRCGLVASTVLPGLPTARLGVVRSG